MRLRVVDRMDRSVEGGVVEGGVGSAERYEAGGSVGREGARRLERKEGLVALAPTTLMALSRSGVSRFSPTWYIEPLLSCAFCDERETATDEFREGSPSSFVLSSQSSFDSLFAPLLSLRELILSN